MKKIIVTTLALGGGLLLVSSANALIASSAHDFSNQGWGTTQICQPCHTPHNGTSQTVVSGAPLWNHEVTSATYTLYSSGTLDATDLGQPGGVSKLCLSCHDGTVALDSFGGMTGSSFITGNANLGTDLSNDHPVSFTYDTALSGIDTGLHDPSGTTSGLGGNIDADMLYGVGNTQLECASCHDVHNEYNLSFLLKKSNAASALCLTCHNK